MKITIIFKNGRAKVYNSVYDIHVDSGILWIHFYAVDGSVTTIGHRIATIADIPRIDFI